MILKTLLCALARRIDAARAWIDPLGPPLPAARPQISVLTDEDYQALSVIYDLCAAPDISSFTILPSKPDDAVYYCLAGSGNQPLILPRRTAVRLNTYGLIDLFCNITDAGLDLLNIMELAEYTPAFLAQGAPA